MSGLDRSQTSYFAMASSRVATLNCAFAPGKCEKGFPQIDGRPMYTSYGSRLQWTTSFSWGPLGGWAERPP